ncbi:MAG: hypothetical protein ACJ72E_08365 [Marmoricola sp.]
MRDGAGMPGFGGYLAAFAIGFAVFALLSMITVGRTEHLVVVLGLPLAMASGRACVIPVAVERGRR